MSAECCLASSVTDRQARARRPLPAAAAAEDEAPAEPALAARGDRAPVRFLTACPTASSSRGAAPGRGDGAPSDFERLAMEFGSLSTVDSLPGVC
jgi:hypothetical protein